MLINYLSKNSDSSSSDDQTSQTQVKKPTATTKVIAQAKQVTSKSEDNTIEDIEQLINRLEVEKQRLLNKIDKITLYDNNGTTKPTPTV